MCGLRGEEAFYEYFGFTDDENYWIKSGSNDEMFDDKNKNGMNARWKCYGIAMAYDYVN